MFWKYHAILYLVSGSGSQTGSRSSSSVGNSFSARFPHVPLEQQTIIDLLNWVKSVTKFFRVNACKKEEGFIVLNLPLEKTTYCGADYPTVEQATYFGADYILWQRLPTFYSVFDYLLWSSLLSLGKLYYWASYLLYYWTGYLPSEQAFLPLNKLPTLGAT